jgi:hypothetical protein
LFLTYSDEIWYKKLRDKIDINELNRFKREIWDKNDNFQIQIDTLTASIYQLKKRECPTKNDLIEFQNKAILKPELDDVNLGLKLYFICIELERIRKIIEIIEADMSESDSEFSEAEETLTNVLGLYFICPIG